MHKKKKSLRPMAVCVFFIVVCITCSAYAENKPIDPRLTGGDVRPLFNRLNPELKKTDGCTEVVTKFNQWQESQPKTPEDVARENQRAAEIAAEKKELEEWIVFFKGLENLPEFPENLFGNSSLTAGEADKILQDLLDIGKRLSQ